MEEFTIIDSYSGQSEIPIRTERELRDQLQYILKGGTNQIITLHSGNSGDLILGLGSPYGFVEYISNTGKPPYHIATSLSDEKKSDYYEFDAGGTPTPIPADNCLLINQVLDIAIFFYNHSEIPKDFKWEEE
jgi:hypothetical protein